MKQYLKAHPNKLLNSNNNISHMCCGRQTKMATYYKEYIYVYIQNVSSLEMSKDKIEGKKSER